MPLFENHVGVSVSLDKIRLVELVYSDDEFLLENVDEESFSSDLSGENFVNVLRDSFQEIISRKSFSSKNISFCLDPAFFEIFEVPFDNTLLKSDLNEHLGWELSKLKPMLNKADFLIQNIELKKIDENIQSSTAALAIRKSLFNSLVDLSKENKLALKYIDYSHTSSDILLRFMKALKGLSGLSVFKSNEYFSFIIHDALSPVSVIKKRKIENDLPLTQVKSKLDELVSKRTGLSGFLYAFVSGNYVTEEEIQKLNVTFKLNFKTLNPFSLLKKSPTFSSNVEFNEVPSEFASAAGVALRLF